MAELRLDVFFFCIALDKNEMHFYPVLLLEKLLSNLVKMYTKKKQSTYTWIYCVFVVVPLWMPLTLKMHKSAAQCNGFINSLHIFLSLFFCIVVGCFSFIFIYYGRFYCIRRRYKIWLLITKGYLNARLSHWRRFLSNKTRIQPKFFLFRYNVKQQNNSNNSSNSSKHSLEKKAWLIYPIDG